MWKKSEQGKLNRDRHIRVETDKMKLNFMCVRCSFAIALQRVLDAVIEEAARFLLGRVEIDRYQAMRNYVPQLVTTSIFENGLKLGKQLEEEMSEEMRWKVLADFWPDILLYISPSDNVKEHIEQLTKGGEFITHLWALLTHAGIPQKEHHPGSV
uniref:Uncharacterized protein n=1 Tax=Leersia perrieri TaxID=77586 RepID=A0A0D9WUV7_9ORYZ